METDEKETLVVAHNLKCLCGEELDRNRFKKGTSEFIVSNLLVGVC